MFRAEGKVALVTGGATGLGAAAAIALGRQGADVVVSDRPGEALESTCEQLRELRVRVLALELDVRVAEQRTNAVREAAAAFGGIDILVNNAGINRPKPGLEVTEDLWDEHSTPTLKAGSASPNWQRLR